MAAKILLKRALGQVARLRPAAAQRKLILLYHSVGASPWAMPEAEFLLQMRWLGQNVKLVSLPQLLEDEFDDPLQAAITFDDGYASLRDKALPVLRELGAVASVFINTGCIADQARNPSDPDLGHYPEEAFLSWRDVEELAAAGWTIGSHGVDHLDLTAVSPASADAQLRASKRTIETRIEPADLYFAYPWGRHNSASRHAVARAGYQCALSCEHAPVHEGFDRWAVPRVNISKDYSLNDFAAVVAGDWDYLGWAQKLKVRK
jgi:peptidoglycan/xylan/chitin deacetylase (PgdA/CDA1 family)